MRRLALFALLLAPAPLRAADFDPKPIDAIVERTMKEFQVPGAAVVVVRDGQVVYLKGFGVREKGGTEPVTENTVFAIASCTKAFTATLIGMLADDGKLKWDDKVRDHLDTFRLSDELADREVTLRDLLCHRSGMPRHDMLWSGLSLDSPALVKQWGKAKGSTSFRSTWEYANVPFTTASLIAGRMEKTDWAGAVQKRIFDPLKMTHSSATLKAGSNAADHATPHYFALTKSVVPVKWDDVDAAGGAGSINSTATDMAKWLQFQLAGGKVGDTRLISEKALGETHRPQMLFKPEGTFAYYFPPQAGRFHAYGLGWFTHDYRGFDCVSHGGTLTGFRAQCMMVPEKKVGVFVVSNLRPSMFTEVVAKTALDQLLGLPAEDWLKDGKSSMSLFDFNVRAAKTKRETERKPGTRHSLPLAWYAGTYTETAYGKAEVVFEDDKLLVKWGKFTFRLDHFHFDTFTAVPIEPKEDLVTFDRTTFDAQFRLGTNGEIESLRLFDQDFRRAPTAKK